MLSTNVTDLWEVDRSMEHYMFVCTHYESVYVASAVASRHRGQGFQKYSVQELGLQDMQIPLPGHVSPDTAKTFWLSRGVVLFKSLPKDSLKATGCSLAHHRAVCSIQT